MKVSSRILWFVGGALAVLATEVGLVAWDFYRLPSWKPSDDWRTAGPVAVSPRWSVVLEEQPAHPFLAEYNYRLRIFVSEERDGRPYGTVDLHPNTGGRTHLCLFTIRTSSGELYLEVVDRNQASLVDLKALSLDPVPLSALEERRLLGEFLEEAAPLRFVPAEADSSCPWSA